MPTYSGRNASVKKGTYTIAELGSWSIERTQDEIDTTAFGSTWGKSDVGFQKWSASFTGFFDPTDTNGQVAMESAMNAGTLVNDIKFHFSANSYFTPDVTTDSNAGGRVTSFNVGQDKAGVASLNMTMTGSGPITRV